MFHLFTNIHLLSTYYVLSLIFLDICIFLPLLLLFLVMITRYPAVHHPLATVLSVAKKDDNKLMVKNSGEVISPLAPV